MRVPFIILIICSLNSLKGQIGLQSNDSLIWQYRTWYTTGPGGPGQGPQYFYTYNYQFLNGDTIINAKKHKKLYSSTSSQTALFSFDSLTFDSYLVEDSNRVYQGTPGNMNLILDYNLQVSDSFQFRDYAPKLVVLNIDSILIGSNYYRRFHFDRSIVWIQGIGDVSKGATFGSYYFLNPSPYTWMSRDAQFRCYAEHLLPFYGSLCSLPFSINEVKEKNTVIYPNPSNGLITMSNLVGENTIEVYDITGRVVYSTFVNSTSKEIDLTTQSKGIYFYKVINENNQSQQGKLIIQ